MRNTRCKKEKGGNISDSWKLPLIKTLIVWRPGAPRSWGKRAEISQFTRINRSIEMERGEYEWFLEDSFHHYFCMNVWPRSWGKRAGGSQFTRIGVHNLTQGGCHTARRLLCQNMHSPQKRAAFYSWQLIFSSSAFITEFDFLGHLC